MGRRMVAVLAAALFFVGVGCTLDIAGTNDEPDPTPTQEIFVTPTPAPEYAQWPVWQCLTLELELEPLKPLSQNPCLQGKVETGPLITMPPNDRFQAWPEAFTPIARLNPANGCNTPFWVFHRERGTSDARGFRVDISEVCGQFGFEHPPLPVECERNLVLKMSTWSSYFDIDPDQPSFTSLLMTVETALGPHVLPRIGIPNSGFSGNVRVIRFEGCESTVLEFSGVLDVTWASAEGEVTIQGLEVLQPEDTRWGNEIAVVLQG